MAETNDYQVVSECIKQFHEKFPNGVIETSFVIDGEMCHFNAKVIPEFEKPATYFSGYSFWSLDKEKVLERIKTIALWRALALAGFEIGIEVAKPKTTAKTLVGTQETGKTITALPDKATDKQISLIIDKCARLGITADARTEYLIHSFNIDSLGQLTKNQASNFIVALTDKKIVAGIKGLAKLKDEQ